MTDDDGEERDNSGNAGHGSQMTDGNQTKTKKSTWQIFFKYVLMRSLGLTFYCLDIASDLSAAYTDYEAGDEVFAYATLGLVFTPGVIFAMYMCSEVFTQHFGELSCLRGFLWLISAPVLPLWPILRGIKQVCCGLLATICPSRRPQMHEVLNSPSRAYIVKFLEAFTEAAPQLLLRLLRVALRNPQQFSDLKTSEILQVSFSSITLALKVITTFHKNVTTTQIINGELEPDDRFRLPLLVQFAAFIWWLCFLVCRFEALALFGASFGLWLLLVLALHITLVFLLQTVTSRKNIFRRIFIYLFAAFVFVFAYVHINIKSRLKVAAWYPYTVFTVLIFIENSIILILWFLSELGSIPSTFNGSIRNFIDDNSLSYNSTTNATTSDTYRPHWELLLFVHYGSFAVGLVFMVITFCLAPHIDQQEESEEEEEEGEALDQDVETQGPNKQTTAEKCNKGQHSYEMQPLANS